MNSVDGSGGLRRSFAASRRVVLGGAWRGGERVGEVGVVGGVDRKSTV